jgi:phasin family protein
MTKNAGSFFDFDLTKMMTGFDPAAVAGDFFRLAGSTKLPGFDVEALVESQRKTVAALGAANRAAFEGAQKVFRRQAEMVQESLGGITPGLGDLAASATPGDAAATQVRLVKDAYEKAVADGRELVDLMTKSGRATATPIQKRIVEGLDEIKAQADKLGA